MRTANNSNPKQRTQAISEGYIVRSLHTLRAPVHMTHSHTSLAVSPIRCRTPQSGALRDWRTTHQR